MKKLIPLSMLLISFIAMAAIDSQISTRPDRAFMNFFLDGYLEWHEKNFGMRPKLGSKEGDLFLDEAIKQLDHWRIPEKKNLDQILIGQGFDQNAKPFYNFRIYLAAGLRNHPYLAVQRLPFLPLFVEKTKEDGICFIGEIELDKITWKSVPKFLDATYLQSYCQNAAGKFELKYIQYLAYDEDPAFPNPFKGQADFELRSYSIEELEKKLLFVRTTHTMLLLPQHIPYINSHGVSTLMPFDKFSINQKGEMVIYYP